MANTDKRRRINLFDFDGTLFRGDSFGDFPIFIFGRLRFCKALLRSIPDLIMWKMGKISNSQAKERFFARLYVGLPVKDIDRLAQGYVKRIDNKLNPLSARRFKEALMRGEEVYVISASPEIWLRPWIESVRKDFPGSNLYLLATVPEVTDGILTGRFATPNCHGPEKTRRLILDLEERAQTEGTLPPVRGDMYITAHGDSSGDKEMFEYADKYYKY